MSKVNDKHKSCGRSQTSLSSSISLEKIDLKFILSSKRQFLYYPQTVTHGKKHSHVPRLFIIHTYFQIANSFHHQSPTLSFRKHKLTVQFIYGTLFSYLAMCETEFFTLLDSALFSARQL